MLSVNAFKIAKFFICHVVKSDPVATFGIRPRFDLPKSKTIKI